MNRRIKGLIQLTIFFTIVFVRDLQDILFFSKEFMKEYWWAPFIQILIAYFVLRCLVVGVYQFTAGEQYVPGFDNGDYSFMQAAYDFIFRNNGIAGRNRSYQKNGIINPNIARIVEYRNARMSMMDNQSALNEASETAGIEVMMNSNTRQAKFLDSQLAMKSNDEGLNYAKTLFSNKP